MKYYNFYVGVVLSVIFRFCLGGGAAPEVLLEINNNIETLKSQLKNMGNDDGRKYEKAQLWANLGMALQVKDVRIHEGGGALQPEALHAFDEALSLADKADKRLLITVNQFKGILLKMMGRGEESVAAHDIVIEIAESDYDKASAIFNKAEALSMLGRLKESIEFYRETLRINPDALQTYLPMIKVLRELNEFSKEEWHALVKEMKDALNKWQNSEFDTSSHSQGVLWQGESGLSSEIYWALFEVNNHHTPHPSSSTSTNA